MNVSESANIFHLTHLVQSAVVHGLLNASASQSPENSIDPIHDLDTKWKAWSRLDCAKR